MVLGRIYPKHFLECSALTGESANTLLDFAYILPLNVKQCFHVLELFGLIRSIPHSKNSFPFATVNYQSEPQISQAFDLIPSPSLPSHWPPRIRHLGCIDYIHLYISVALPTYCHLYTLYPFDYIFSFRISSCYYFSITNSRECRMTGADELAQSERAAGLHKNGGLPEKEHLDEGSIIGAGSLIVRLPFLSIF